MGSSGSFWVLLGPSGSIFTDFSRPYLSLLGLTGLYWALLGLTGSYWASLGLTGPYRALMGLAGPYWALLDSFFAIDDGLTD